MLLFNTKIDSVSCSQTLILSCTLSCIDYSLVFYTRHSCTHLTACPKHIRANFNILYIILIITLLIHHYYDFQLHLWNTITGFNSVLTQPALEHGHFVICLAIVTHTNTQSELNDFYNSVHYCHWLATQHKIYKKIWGITVWKDVVN